MSERETYKIQQTKERIFASAHWRCEFPSCCESATELAHIIGQGEFGIQHTRKLWNEMFSEARSCSWIRNRVIHNDLNMRASCRRHNDYFNIGNSEAKHRELLQRIKNNIKAANHD